MKMSLKIILILYAITCICSCDLIKTNHIAYTCTYISMTNKSVMTLIYVNKIHACLSVCLLNINCDNPSVVGLGFVLY